MYETISNSHLARLAGNSISADLWGEFYRLYRAKVYSIFRLQMGLSEVESEDAWQETISAMRGGAFQKFDRSKSRSGRFSPFLMGVAKNAARKIIRDRVKCPPPPLETSETGESVQALESVADSSPSPDERAEIDGEILQLRSMLQAFAENKLFDRRTVECVWEQFESDAYGKPTKLEIALKYGYISAITSEDQKIPNSMYEARSAVTRDLRLASRCFRAADEHQMPQQNADSRIQSAIELIKHERAKRRLAKS
jgi:hypothetical protein